MPYDNNVSHAQEVGSGNLLYHARDLRRLQLAMVGGSPSIGGGVVRPMSHLVTPGGGLTLSIAEGGALIGSTSANHGLWFAYNDGADTSQTLDVADPSHSRIDRIFTQVLENEYDSTGVNTTGFGRVKGVADGSNTLPALPTGRILELARVTLGAGVTNLTAGAILDVRPYLPLGKPVGLVEEWYSTVLPVGAIWADGAAVSRTTYAALFFMYGTRYGAGDGSTTFNVPDKRGVAAIGSDTMGQGARGVMTEAGASTLGAKIGAETVALDVTQMPPHFHGAGDANVDGFVGHAVSNSTSAFQTGAFGFGVRVNTVTDTRGSGAAHANVQPSIVANYIIWV